VFGLQIASLRGAGAAWGIGAPVGMMPHELRICGALSPNSPSTKSDWDTLEAHMQNRLANIASALVAGLVATSGLAIAADGGETRITECLAGPKGAPPEGSHWYYRVDRVQNRRCWYLGDAEQKRVAFRRQSAPEKPVRTSSKPALSRQVANARAEFEAWRSNTESPDLPTLVATAAPPRVDSSAPADDPVAADRWTLAQRWPDRTEENAATGLEPTVLDANAALPSNATNRTASAPVLAAAPTPAGKPSATGNSVQLLMIVLAASLAFAGVIATALLTLARNRRTDGRDERSVISDALDTIRAPWRVRTEARASAFDAGPTLSAPDEASQLVPPWLITARPR
jgi:hypothetical protein